MKLFYILQLFPAAAIQEEKDSIQPRFKEKKKRNRILEIPERGFVFLKTGFI